MAELVDSTDAYWGPRRRISLVALVAVNLLPLAGVVFLDWDVASLMVLYWSENIILGFFTLLKMVMVAPLGTLFAGPFFVIHYGGFCGVHGLFLVSLLLDSDFSPMPDDPWPAFLVFPQLLLNVCLEVLRFAPPEWMFAFAALFASHGISFMVNFLRGPEREAGSAQKLMTQPYGRIVVLHVAILFGAFAISIFGEKLFMLVILVLVKLGLDVTLHLREHRKAAP
ncbi:hypothetical protein E4634_05785 [Mangrovimicrobium sediminis]|uniref:Uncharacterized protein n=1 Tax=Mangrovimicrobium sediminis TaxID=2562682 RepID=A0A4Z0M5L5_9GAMM|nr:DUF6498-containing protein [Haliea sp. SAOS-164]TGD74710.1 hypothetical protein E4634_05785 [Haliea sp. SAOS-164]